MSKMIVILNKTDMIPEEKREEMIKKRITNLQKVFAKTRFGENVPMIPISAAVNAAKDNSTINISLLL